MVILTFCQFLGSIQMVYIEFDKIFNFLIFAISLIYWIHSSPPPPPNLYKGGEMEVGGGDFTKMTVIGGDGKFLLEMGGS